jgi:hypothetical protein
MIFSVSGALAVPLSASVVAGSVFSLSIRGSFAGSHLYS